MVEGGAVDEVRRHRNARTTGPPSRTAAPRGVERAIGYREISAHLDGHVSIEEAVDLLAAATRRYVRRQLTWMRKLDDAVIMDVSRSTAEETASSIMDRARALRSSVASVDVEHAGSRAGSDAASNLPG
jgi:tRNA A37 N6-isopentenylltransferase MiaA